MEVIVNMNLIKRMLIIVLIISLTLLCACQQKKESLSEIPDATGQFGFDVLKVGQADAIIMQSQSQNIIIDLGEADDGEEIVNHLVRKNINTIDYLFITHFDKDHVGGFPYLAGNVEIKNIIVPDYEGSSDEYYAYCENVKTKKLPVTVLSKNTSFVFDDVLFEVSVPKKKAYIEGDNDFSLVISATHGENTFLFTGDAESARISELLSEFGKKHDFLKVPHHGKHNKNTKRLINTVKPQYAVVCDSEKNPASDKTLSILESAGSEIYCTKNGDVSVVSNGVELIVTQ